MSRRSFGLIIGGIGVAVTVIALLADPIGVGGSDDFGWKQLLGVVIGVALVAWGFVMASDDDESQPD